MMTLTLEQGKASKSHLKAMLADAQLGIIRLDSLDSDKCDRWVVRLHYASQTMGEMVNVSAKI